MGEDELLRLALVGVAFLVAGSVKGLVGMGMPTVALALMATVLRLPEAMAVMLAPTLVTNIWQALAGPHLRAILARFWPFLAMLAPGILAGTALLAGADIRLLTILLGGIVAFYAVFTLAGQSLFAVAPALAGMWLGAKLRRRLSETAFRRLFAWALLGLGLWIAGRTLLLGVPGAG